MTTDELPSGVPPAASMPTARWCDLPAGAAFAVRDAFAGRLAAMRELARRRSARLRARGADERALGHRLAIDSLNSLVQRVATAELINRIVDVQLDRVVRPLVGAILDDVLARLEAEPDRIQALVRGQRENMVDDLVGRLRTSAAAGDAAIDRLTRRASRPVSGSAEPPPTSGAL